MPRENVHYLTEAIPQMQIERRQRMDELERLAQREADHAMQMLVEVMVFCLVVTGCLLAWVYL